jgi:hypothetical protein
MRFEETELCDCDEIEVRESLMITPLIRSNSLSSIPHLRHLSTKSLASVMSPANIIRMQGLFILR